MSSVDSGWCVFDRCWQIAMEEPPEFCVVRATYIKVQKLGLCLQSLIFLIPRRVSPFSRGVVFTLARVSLAHLSLRKNGTTCSLTFVISRFYFCTTVIRLLVENMYKYIMYIDPCSWPDLTSRIYRSSSCKWVNWLKRQWALGHKLLSFL